MFKFSNFTVVDNKLYNMLSKCSVCPILVVMFRFNVFFGLFKLK